MIINEKGNKDKKCNLGETFVTFCPVEAKKFSPEKKFGV